MNAKIIASLAFTSMFSLSTLLSPAHAEEQEKALNFGHYFNGITAKPETAMDAILTGYGEEAGREGERLLCPRLRRHYPGNALQ